MYVHSVKLTNYRSIGDYAEAEVIIEPQVTAIVGKNESGKSNVLEGLSRINLHKENRIAFDSNLANRIETQKQIRYMVVLKPTQSEKDSLGITDDTTVSITSTEYRVLGGLKAYYDAHVGVLCLELVQSLGKLGSNPLKLSNQDLTDYKSYLAELQRADYLNVYRVGIAIEFIGKRLESIPADKRADVAESLEKASKQFHLLVSLLPTFFYRKTDKQLQERYKSEEVDKELTSPQSYPNSLLSNLVKVIDIPVSDFKLAVKSGMNPNQSTIRKRIERRIKDKVNTPFQSFYTTEVVSLDVEFNNGEIGFLVQSSDGEVMKLSERSNGLRWYLNTFIDMLANNIQSKHVVYLLDEPGVSLHVNAQRELLNLFRDLASKGNQVVYSTHSPTMLDTSNEGLHRIRAVVKDAAGYTRIYKTPYDKGISVTDSHDTLTPIVNAIGMNLTCVFGPAQDKLNIVPEGMSDYIYLTEMAKILQLDESKYTIIPTIGASNAINICAILTGWGCPFIAVFDYDDAGVNSGGECMRKNFEFSLNSEYCYLSDVTQQDIENKTYKKNKVVIETLVGEDEIRRYCKEANRSPEINKTLMAKLMCNAYQMDEFKFAEESIQRFKVLFDRIKRYTNRL